MTAPDVQVLIDWDNDGRVNPDDVPADNPNRFITSDTGKLVRHSIDAADGYIGGYNMLMRQDYYYHYMNGANHRLYLGNQGSTYGGYQYTWRLPEAVPGYVRFARDPLLGTTFQLPDLEGINLAISHTPIALVSGRAYVFSCFVKLVEGDPTYTIDMFLTNDIVGEAVLATGAAVAVTMGEWVQVFVTYTPPSNQNVQVNIRANGASKKASEFNITGVMLQRGTTPSSYYVENEATFSYVFGDFPRDETHTFNGLDAVRVYMDSASAVYTAGLLPATIEGVAIPNTPAIVSFWVKTLSGTGTFTVATEGSLASGAGAAVFTTAGTTDWTKVTIPIVIPYPLAGTAETDFCKIVIGRTVGTGTVQLVISGWMIEGEFGENQIAETADPDVIDWYPRISDGNALPWQTFVLLQSQSEYGTGGWWRGTYPSFRLLDIPIKPNTWYEFSVWARVTLSNGGNARIEVIFNNNQYAIDDDAGLEGLIGGDMFRTVFSPLSNTQWNNLRFHLYTGENNFVSPTFLVDSNTGGSSYVSLDIAGLRLVELPVETYGARTNPLPMETNGYTLQAVGTHTPTLTFLSADDPADYAIYGLGIHSPYDNELIYAEVDTNGVSGDGFKVQNIPVTPNVLNRIRVWVSHNYYPAMLSQDWRVNLYNSSGVLQSSQAYGEASMSSLVMPLGTYNFPVGCRNNAIWTQFVLYEFQYNPGAATTVELGLVLNEADVNNGNAIMMGGIYVSPVADTLASVPPGNTTYTSIRSRRGYDNITPYVLSFQTSSGKDKFETALAYEGDAEIILNNDNQYFSPANEASPYYGLLRDNLKVVIRLKHPETGTWVNLWTGWTHVWNAQAGETGTRQASLSCRQGIFRLQDGEFSPSIYEQTELSDVVQKVIGASGWKSAATTQQAQVGFSRLDEDAYLMAPAEVFNLLQEGVMMLDFVGDEWGRKTNLSTVLNDLLGAENAHLWIDRDGRLNVANREHFLNRGEAGEYDYAIDLGTTVGAAEFKRGHDVVNRVDVFVKAKNEEQDAVIWQSNGTIALQGRVRNNDRRVRKGLPIIYHHKDVELNFSFPEGHPRTVTKVYSLEEGSTITVYRNREFRVRGQRYVATDELTGRAKARVSMRINKTSNGTWGMRLINQNLFPVHVFVTLRGDYVIPGEGEVYTFEDTEAIQDQNAVYSQAITVNTYESEVGAMGLADTILLRKSRPYAEFTNLRLQSRDIPFMTRMFDYTIGTFLLLTEGQTLEASLPHVVIGEDFNYTPGHLEVIYKLAALDLNHYATEDDKLTDVGLRIFP